MSHRRFRRVGTGLHLVALSVLLMLDSKDIAVAKDAPSRIVHEIAPTGSLRAAINFGNPVLAQRGADGAPAGVSADLARELGRRLGVSVSFETFDTAGAVVEALGGPRTWDVAFLAVDPHRARTIAFSPPYVVIEGAYMVREGSPLTRNDQVDRPGIRIAVGRNSAYDLFLGRHLKMAERVFAPSSTDALALFLREGPDVLASVRQPLEAYARDHKDVRILPGRFMVIEQAVATPSDRPSATAYTRTFIEEMKASGFVAQALERSGQRDALVAPAAQD